MPETGHNICIRHAGFDDLPDIARIHVMSWQQAYVGQIPQAYLDGLDIAARQKKWEEHFKTPSGEEKNLYLAHRNDEAVGFISFGRCRDKDLNDQGEIYAIYLLQEQWGQGAGYMLFNTAAKILRDAGYAKASIWVLNTNQRAIDCYLRWGGMLDPVRVKDDIIGEQPVREVAVVFDLTTDATNG